MYKLFYSLLYFLINSINYEFPVIKIRYKKIEISIFIISLIFFISNSMDLFHLLSNFKSYS